MRGAAASAVPAAVPAVVVDEVDETADLQLLRMMERRWEAKRTVESMDSMSSREDRRRRSWSSISISISVVWRATCSRDSCPPNTKPRRGWGGGGCYIRCDYLTLSLASMFCSLQIWEVPMDWRIDKETDVNCHRDAKKHQMKIAVERKKNWSGAERNKCGNSFHELRKRKCWREKSRRRKRRSGRRKRRRER